MKKICYFSLLVILLPACKKDDAPKPVLPVVHPVMQYLDLHDEAINFGQHKLIDINSDGVDDLLFSTLLVGDPALERDRRQFYASSGTESRLLANTNDQSPVLSKGDPVSLQHSGYQWFEVISILLAEKIIPMAGNSFWQGDWKQASHKYLPVQVKKNGNIYNGWIEISFDTILEKLILHKASICKEPGKTISAGV